MGGNLPPVVRAFRERNQTSGEEKPTRRLGGPEPLANPEPAGADSSVVTPLGEAAAASTEWLARAFRERKQRTRQEKPARSPEPTASPAVLAEPRDAAPSILTPLMEMAAASSERLVRALRKWKQRFRKEGRARSPQPAVPRPVENPEPGDAAPSIATPLIGAAAASGEWLARTFGKWNQQFRREGRARSPQPAVPGPVENPEPGGAAPSFVTPRIAAAPAPTEWPKFPGDMGYADRLRANAALLAKLILMASTVGVTAAEIWQDRWPDVLIKLGPDELKSIKSEAALVCIGFIEEMADKSMLPLDKSSLMTKLQALVASGLQSVHGIDAASFQPLLHARSQEYRECKEARGKEGAAGDQAFLRQAANRIAATIGIGDSPFFNDTVTDLLLKQFARWGVPDLLRR